MSMRFLRATSLFRRVVHFDNLKQSSRFTSLSLSLRSNQEKFKFRRSKWNYVIGGVGLFGFNFGSKDDEEIEPELIMTIKRSILLIQVDKLQKPSRRLIDYLMSGLIFVNFQKEEYKKAEQMLHVALRQAQTINHYEGVTYVYDVMANLAFQVGEIQKSIDLFKTVMQRLLSTGTEQNDTKIIHMSLKVANLYQRAGDNKTAEEGYKFCIEKIEEHAVKNPTDEDILVLWAMSRDWYANMLLSESRLSEALENYQKSYQLCTEIYGKNHEQTVILLNDLGTVCCLLGQHDRALGYLSDAIETGSKLPDCPELSSIYVNLGNVYIKKSLYNEAKAACFEGLKRAKKNEDQECRDQANLCLAEVKKCLNR